MYGGFWKSITLVAALGCVATIATGQVIERDRKVTGPRGRTVERKVTSERVGGRVERDVKITRPDGTFERDTSIQRTPGGVQRQTRIQRPGGATFERDVSVQRGPGGVERDVRVQRPGGATFERDVRVQRSWGGGGYGGPRYIERDVIVGGPRFGPAFGFAGPGIGIGLPFFNFMFSSPPVYVAPPPPPVVVAQPPPTIVYEQPPFDAFNDAYGRLESYHSNSRRDGSLTLGRLGDPRAVPALMDRLEKDHEKEVRVAAAWALGEIGDPRALLALDRAALYDRRQDVRNAASQAINRLKEHETIVEPAESAPTSAAPVQSESSAIRNDIPEPLPLDDPNTPPPPPRPEGPR